LVEVIFSALLSRKLKGSTTETLRQGQQRVCAFDGDTRDDERSNNAPQCGRRKQPFKSPNKSEGSADTHLHAWVCLRSGVILIYGKHFPLNPERHLTPVSPLLRGGEGDGSLWNFPGSSNSYDFLKRKKCLALETFTPAKKDHAPPTGSRRYGRLAACATTI